MELSIEEALLKGVEAHKAGQVQEADRFYTAILKAQPKHPDANHNMGVLAVGVGKVAMALPFLKTALEANPSIAQFWISYIDALLKLDRRAEAKTIFEQAKSKGVQGEALDKLSASFIEKPETSQSTILDTAIKLREIGKFDQAISVLKDDLKRSDDCETLTLLSHCYILVDDIENAKFYLDKAKAISSDSASVSWNTARIMLKEKRFVDALNVAKTACERFPNNIEGMVVLGTCLRANGQLVESLEILDGAIALKPDYAEALINRGLLMLSEENKTDALVDLELAHSLKPHIKQIWDLVVGLKIEAQEYSDAINILENIIQFEPDNHKRLVTLAQCYRYLESYDLATNAYKKAIAIKPDYAEAYVSLGSILKTQGHLNEAISVYSKALSIKPDYAEAYVSLGAVLKAQGNLREAKAAYKKAIAIKPDYAEAFNNMGNLLKEQGNPEEAIVAYKKALSFKPDYVEVYSNIGNALRGVSFKQPNPNLQKIIDSLLDKKSFVRPIDIAFAAISLLKLETRLKRHLQSSAMAEVDSNLLAVIQDLSTLPLLLKLMSVCPLPDVDLEDLFKKLRARLLLSISDLAGSTEELEFRSALALQCFTNEYIYNQSEHEGEALAALEVSVKQALSEGEQPSPQSVLCLASYRPLYKYDWSSLLHINDEIADVFIRQVVEPNQEAKMKTDLPVLEEITDKVSSKVRDQYEASPYPRWINLSLPMKPVSISKVVNGIPLKLTDDKIKEVEAPNILIAGCGTGQHSLSTATRFNGSKVLAIDLSLSSLSYAKRKTEELGIENIDYMQADILDLDKLGRQFDIVESAGVLHHMDDPVAGWKVLTNCLKPGGLMKIGLYSELARQHIVEMRQEISEADIGLSDVAMKSFRARIMASELKHHKRILNSSDFYSLSTLKDLLFHVQEHRFTIPQIQDCLFELGLNFCGFESDRTVVHFKQTNTGADDPYDLDRWQAYEEANPAAFARMYQFWCQKVV